MNSLKNVTAIRRWASTVGDFGEFRLGMKPKVSVATLGGDYKEDLTRGRKPRHVSNFGS